MTEQDAPETGAQFRRRYMMGTTATHKLGDISRAEPHLLVVDGEDGQDWIGRWVEGFGFFNVRFPKASTRDLTADEIAKYHGAMWALNGEPVGRLEVRAGGTKPRRASDTATSTARSTPGSRAARHGRDG